MKLLKILLIAAVLLPLGSAATDLEVNVQSVSPQPATPGENAEVSLVIRNDGEDPVTLGPVDVQTAAGIRYAGTTSSFREEFTLCGGCQQIGTLYLRINEDAGSGLHPLDIQVPSDSLTYSSEVQVEVDGAAVLTGAIEENSVAQGERANLTVEVSNVGTDAASSSVLSFSSQRFAVSPTSVSLGTLEPGDRAERTLSIVPDSSLESGSKRLNMTVAYTEDAERTSTSFGGSIDVVDRAELVLDQFSADDLVIGRESEVSVEVENLGPGTAERISVQLDCQGAEMKSRRAFVGELEDGETIPATFTVTPRESQVSCSLDVDYSDAQSRSVSAQSEFAASSTNNRTPLYAGAAIVVLLVIYFLYRRRRDELEQV